MGTTPNLGIPYPEASDLVSEAHLHQKAIADAVDALAIGFTAGTATIAGITNATFFTLKPAETSDPRNLYDPATGEFTVTRKGIYVLTGSCQYPAAAGGFHRLMAIMVKPAGGAYAEEMRGNSPVSNTASLSAVVAHHRLLNVGDKVMWQAYQDTGAAVTCGPVRLGASLAAGVA